LIDEFVETLDIGVPVPDRSRGDPGIHGGPCHRRRDLDDQARIEWLRDQVFRTEAGDLLAVGRGDHLRLLGARQLGDGLDGGHLHLLGDRRRADIEGAAEDEREAQHVVDLVRVIRAAGAHDGVVADAADQFRHDLRGRVGKSHDQRPGSHRGDHFGLQHATGGEADEDVGAGDDFTEGSRSGLLRIARLDFVHQFDAALMDQALDVGHPDVLDRRPEQHQQIDAGERRGAGARGDDLDGPDVLADQVQSVEYRRADDDRRAVLVVVEDRDPHPLAQLPLDVEAFGRLDVLEIDAAEGRLERGDGVDQLVRIATRRFPDRRHRCWRTS
jgi:hypothetical protein